MQNNAKIFLIAGLITGLVGGVFCKYLIAFESNYLATHTLNSHKMIFMVVATPVMFIVGLYILSVAVCKIFIK